eukprot:3490530-Lingulodinium_polyedra.AAC.1
MRTRPRRIMRLRMRMCMRTRRRPKRMTNGTAARCAGPSPQRPRQRRMSHVFGGARKSEVSY